jgi:hypothetical protein
MRVYIQTLGITFLDLTDGIHEVSSDTEYTIQQEGHSETYVYEGLQSWLERHAEELI